MIIVTHDMDFAKSIANRVFYMNEGIIYEEGTPDEIFSGDYINYLYDIKRGSYNDKYGFSELEKISGKPEIFVICGGGAEIYRKLQRQGIPFAAGIIHENDIEYPVVSALASVMISEKAYEPISTEKISLAKNIIKNCRKVICLCDNFGTMNRGNLELLEFAEQQKKSSP
jgi:iron complex transport system ATP-binding protein